MDPRFARHRTLLAGALASLAAGLSLGSYLKAGELFPDRPAPQVYIPLADARGEAVTFMTDADGRVPTYVSGTDRLWRPPEMPTVRTAWEDPAPDFTGPADPPLAEDAPSADAWSAEPVAYEPTPPPSLGGDILAGVSHTTPVG